MSCLGSSCKQIARSCTRGGGNRLQVPVESALTAAAYWNSECKLRSSWSLFFRCGHRILGVPALIKNVKIPASTGRGRSMKVLLLRSVSALALVVSLFGLLSCGNDQRLIAISVTPQNTTIGGVDCTTSPCQPTIQFRAIGLYNHGGAPKDITSQVQWTTDTPSILQFQSSPAGLLAPTGNGCGTNLGVIATVYSRPGNPVAGSIVTGGAIVSVAGSGC